MPRLLGAMARTAVIAGTASAVNGRVQRRQAERFAQRDADIYAQREAAYEQQVGHQQPAPQVQQPPAQPAAPAEDDTITKLRELAELKDQGILTDEEFAAQKARILNP
ncbi:MAG: SHOCT domain-containing protein [Microthrixaceae bacterium]